jgi:hypothetical protein
MFQLSDPYTPYFSTNAQPQSISCVFYNERQAPHELAYCPVITRWKLDVLRESSSFARLSAGYGACELYAPYRFCESQSYGFVNFMAQLALQSAHVARLVEPEANQLITHHHEPVRH